MSESPRYATLLYDVRKALDVSVSEYFYLDMVYALSRRTGWCFKDLSEIGEDMGMRKSGVSALRDRLIERGLIERNKKGDVRTTDKYEDVAIINRGSVQKVNAVNKSAFKNRTAGSKSELERSKSEPVTEGENNSRITIRNKDLGKGFEAAKLQSAKPSTGSVTGDNHERMDSSARTEQIKQRIRDELRQRRSTVAAPASLFNSQISLEGIAVGGKT